LPAFDFLFEQIRRVLFSPGGMLSVTSLAAALMISAAFFAWQRKRRGRRLRAKVILRALFPRRILRSPSNQADIFYLLFNVFTFGLAFGWAVLSYQFLSNAIIAGLVSVFGSPAPAATGRARTVRTWLSTFRTAP